MKKIVFSHNIPFEYYKQYVQNMKVICPREPLACFTRKEIKEALQDANIFICIADYACDRELIEISNDLEIIGNVGSGYDNVDSDCAKEKGIYVLNTPTAVMESTAEMTIALMLSICRSTVQYDRDLRREKVCNRPLFFVRDMVVYQKKLGIIGLGRIGKSVAKKAVGLGMDILYYNPFQISKEEEKDLHATYMSVDDVLRNADVITLHLPYFPETHHFMNGDRFELMKETAYLINASRGPVVDEKALIYALQTKQIRGAALDVHEFEPNISEEIVELPNIVITPHCSTNIGEVRINMLHELMEGVHNLVNGRTPENIVG